MNSCIFFNFFRHSQWNRICLTLNQSKMKKAAIIALFALATSVSVFAGGAKKISKGKEKANTECCEKSKGNGTEKQSCCDKQPCCSKKG
jgi:hypothetical protein